MCIVFELKINVGTFKNKVVTINVEIGEFETMSLVDILIDRDYIVSWSNNHEFDIIRSYTTSTPIDIDELPSRNSEYPLYPTLSSAGKQEAQQLIDSFKEKLTKNAEDTISNLYCGVVSDIESDSWQNFRNQIMDGYKNYNNQKIQNRWDFKTIRAEIFKQFKSDIIVDLNQDIYEENQQLKTQIADLSQMLRIDRLHSQYNENEHCD